MVASLANEPTLANLKSDLVKAAPEIQVTVDPAKALRGRADRGAGRQRGPDRAGRPDRHAGDTASPDSRSTSSSRSIPTPSPRPTSCAALPVGTVTKVPLGDVASVVQADVQGSITRIDQAPAASISAEILSEDTGAVSAAVQDRIDALKADGDDPAKPSASSWPA